MILCEYAAELGEYPVGWVVEDAETRASSTPASQKSVTQLQIDLKKLGFYNGPVDGRNDEAVTDAIKRFQRDARIPAYGDCAQRCKLALVKALT